MTQPGTPSTLRDGIDPYEHLATKPSAADTCPHCNGVGRVVADDELRFVCGLCGGPRFGALEPGLVPPEPAARALRDAEKARRGRAGWRAASVVSGIALAMMTLVALLFATFGVWNAALIVGVIFVLPFLLSLVVSHTRAKNAGARIAPALDAAWGALAAAAVHARGAASPDQLAKALGVGVTQAEQLHTVVAVDAELGAASGAPRVRIAGESEAGPASSLAPDPRFEALEKRARAAETEAAAAEAGDEKAPLATPRTITASPGDDGSPR